MTKEFVLTEAIVRLSVAGSWTAAKSEWKLHQVYEAEEAETCLCSHYPIIELCVLRNELNGQFATVGNCCVKRFLGLPSAKIFQAVKRVRKEHDKALNIEAIEHAYERGWINEWERNFYEDTMKKQRRALSPSQMQKRIEVNEKMLRNMRRS